MLKNNHGFSLLELSLVIVVIAMISLLSIRYFGTGRFNLKITSAVSQIQKITAASYDWLNRQKQLDFSGSGGGIAISIAQLISSDYLSNNDAQDPWGGNINIVADPTEPIYVRINLPNASLSACNNLKQRLANTAHSQIASCTANSGYYGSF